MYYVYSVHRNDSLQTIWVGSSTKWPVDDYWLLSADIVFETMYIDEVGVSIVERAHCATRGETIRTMRRLKQALGMNEAERKHRLWVKSVVANARRQAEEKYK